MFHTCNTCIYPTHVLHVELHVIQVHMCRTMCNTDVYSTTCVLYMYVLHM